VPGIDAAPYRKRQFDWSTVGSWGWMEKALFGKWLLPVGGWNPLWRGPGGSMSLNPSVCMKGRLLPILGSLVSAALCEGLR
jgi:hypothetical protein